MRKRSSTVSSVPAPVALGTSIVLPFRQHEPNGTNYVRFRLDAWPGIAKGDIIQVAGKPDSVNSPFLFVADHDTPNFFTSPILPLRPPPNSLSREIISNFNIPVNADLTLTKVAPESVSATLIEIYVRDMYMGRREMWRLHTYLAGKCVFAGQKSDFFGCFGAVIQDIYIDDRQVASALVTPDTRIVLRSMSAKTTLFIHVCRELWEFSDDGERYNEKIVHAFLPALVNKWREDSTKHVASVVLFSRVFYAEPEVDEAAGPMRQHEDGRWYKDFYKVVVDLEIVGDWKESLVNLKQSFWTFQRDILLTHHYHRPKAGDSANPYPRLYGELAYAHDGPVLEAINISLNPADSHYIDRALTLTGASTIVITPGTGHFRVPKKLLQFTTRRLLDQGFGVDLVCLTKPPLHRSPLFSFMAADPDPRAHPYPHMHYHPHLSRVPSYFSSRLDLGEHPSHGLVTPSATSIYSMTRESDPLWALEDTSPDAKKKVVYWEPFWMLVTFWDSQADQPFRQDRFVPRARIPEIQALGLLEHDVSSAIAIPYMNDPIPSQVVAPDTRLRHRQAFDHDVFAPYDRSLEEDKSSLPLLPRRVSGLSETSVDETPSTPSVIDSHAAPTTTPPAHMSRHTSAYPRPSLTPRTPSSQRRLSISSNSPVSPEVSRPRTSRSVSTVRASSISGSTLVVDDSPSARGTSPTSNGRSMNPSPSRTKKQRSPSQESIMSTISTISQSPSTSSSIRRRGGRPVITPMATAPSLVARLSGLFAPVFTRSATSLPEVVSVSVGSLNTESVKVRELEDVEEDGTGDSSLPSKATQPIPKISTQEDKGKEINVEGAAPSEGKPTPVPLVRSNSSHSSIRASSQSKLSEPITIATRTSSSELEMDRTAPTIETARPTRPPFLEEQSSSSVITPRPRIPNPLSRARLLPEINPSRPAGKFPYTADVLARRWEHVFPDRYYKSEWTSMSTPACLPMTTSYFPSQYELETYYSNHAYDVFIETAEMKTSFLVPPEGPPKGKTPPTTQDWALLVMREMVSARLIQGFQFVLRPKDGSLPSEKAALLMARRDPVLAPSYLPVGPCDVLRTTAHPVYLSMTDHIHRLEYLASEGSIRVNRLVRQSKISKKPIMYKCLVWPKLGQGYTEAETRFQLSDFDDYGWNSFDMIAAGYEHKLTPTLRFWRTRFLIIPSVDPPIELTGSKGEKLSVEESRLLGADRLAELFSKARWVEPGQSRDDIPPPRFLPTWLDPAASVLDDTLMNALDELNAAGNAAAVPSNEKGKKAQPSVKEIDQCTAAQVVSAMRAPLPHGVPIHDHHWHGVLYENSFLARDFVSWAVREFRDCPTRDVATEWGQRLQTDGVIRHARGEHHFMDGHYYFVFAGDYAIQPTRKQRGAWFGSRSSLDLRSPSDDRPLGSGVNSNRKRHVLSQTMIINTDTNKRSDHAETAILHHDIIHNPNTCFHFELNWIGTSGRCIDDLIRHWSAAISKYGLLLVEGYVDPILKASSRNLFQSCFPIPLALPPPEIPDIAARLHHGTGTKHFFEYAILRRCGYVLDIEAEDSYPTSVDIFYSYRRYSSFEQSQFVHRTGLAFVQVMGGDEGFQWMTNRLFASSNAHAPSNSKGPRAKTPHEAADVLRLELLAFCSDANLLNELYQEALGSMKIEVIKEEEDLESVEGTR